MVDSIPSNEQHTSMYIHSKEELGCSAEELKYRLPSKTERVLGVSFYTIDFEDYEGVAILLGLVLR